MRKICALATRKFLSKEKKYVYNLYSRDTKEAGRKPGKKRGIFQLIELLQETLFFVMQVAYNAPGLPILSNPNCGDYFILDTSWGLAKITIWLLFWVCIGKRPNFPKNYLKLMQEKRYCRIITKLFKLTSYHTSHKCI